MLLFTNIEERFRDARHPLWVEAYEQPRPELRPQKRLALVTSAMTDEDDTALILFAESFESLRIGALACIYWEDLREDKSRVKQRVEEDALPADQCNAM
jgi:hypothetical protein